MWTTENRGSDECRPWDEKRPFDSQNLQLSSACRPDRGREWFVHERKLTSALASDTIAAWGHVGEMDHGLRRLLSGVRRRRFVRRVGGGQLGAANPRRGRVHRVLARTSRLGRTGAGSLLAAIHQATPDENPLKSTTHYLMSGLAAHEGDIHACKGHLHQAMILIQKHLAELATDEDAVHAIKSIMKQYALITPMIDTSAVPATVLGLDGVKAPDSSRGFFVFSSCNGTYFDRFGEAFVRSVCGRADAPACHLHIINPPWDSQPARDALQKRYPALAITTEQGPQEATYYACRRFQVVASLIRHYRKAALVSDIDVVLTPAIRAFDDVGSTVAGVFKKSDLDPMLIMHLSPVLLGVRSRDVVLRGRRGPLSLSPHGAGLCLDFGSVRVFDLRAALPSLRNRILRRRPGPGPGCGSWPIPGQSTFQHRREVRHALATNFDNRTRTARTF